MKINKVSKSGAAPSKVKAPQAVEGTSFSDLMGDKRESDTRHELEQLMLAIRSEGDKLVDAKNIEVLVHYKRMVKDFVSRAVDFAFEIQDRKGLSRFGRGKVLKVVSQIDASLVEITQEFLAEERNRIKLLSKIGELQGMLLNIYA
ncbi:MULTISPECIES: YaaR family protein [unclassified Fusibacter]|uniref:YaaR family protein n=1 Tax=unclassified Fusibacter TaxID=2624464 RepID=UPI0010109E0D|nr:MULTISPECIES: YaaR family protein [unclassified Fusibacter]MCK8059787.1 YaaR family protein [Fusibacter sp. A2]NPE21588.1 YaaR family protein [Fusibacter sp. A1]RXV61995.1 DUF327 family protein [Fusibacter sp. A1]